MKAMDCIVLPSPCAQWAEQMSRMAARTVVIASRIQDMSCNRRGKGTHHVVCQDPANAEGILPGNAQRLERKSETAVWSVSKPQHRALDASAMSRALWMFSGGVPEQEAHAFPLVWSQRCGEAAWHRQPQRCLRGPRRRTASGLGWAPCRGLSRCRPVRQHLAAGICHEPHRRLRRRVFLVRRQRPGSRRTWSGPVICTQCTR